MTSGGSKALAFALVSVGALAISAPGALAQELLSQDDGVSPRVTIDRVVIGLLLIATVLAISTLGFIWHTQPRRRAAAAKKRMAEGGPTSGLDGADRPATQDQSG